MSFNSRKYDERDWVRIRPSLSIGFDFGQINDILSGDRLGVSWSVNPHRNRIIRSQDVIRCAEMGEGQILRQITKLLVELNRATEKPPVQLVTPRARYEFKKQCRAKADRKKLAIEFGLEYWLDLRRDGCDAKIEDLAEFIVRAEQSMESDDDKLDSVTNSRSTCVLGRAH
jgi:hypothetical protein